ncbi:MAG: DUF2510 domain-containing protein [Acidimicrobiales bacterium]
MTTFETRPGDVTSTDPSSAADVTAAGWYSDPFGQHRMRYFSGTEWTDHVTHFGPTPCQGCSC